MTWFLWGLAIWLGILLVGFIGFVAAIFGYDVWIQRRQR